VPEDFRVRRAVEVVLTWLLDAAHIWLTEYWA